jgi:hypothetical protein
MKLLVVIFLSILVFISSFGFLGMISLAGVIFGTLFLVIFCLYRYPESNIKLIISGVCIIFLSTFIIGGPFGVAIGLGAIIFGLFIPNFSTTY